jgi:ribosomal-protein-alanine N-acetyltransferase
MNIIIICEGNGVILRQVQATDAPLLAQWKNEPLIREMAVGWDVVITPENQEKDILGSLDNPNELYAMVIMGTKPIGYIRVNWLDDTGKFVWLRYALGEERGKGYAKDAVGALADWLFDVRDVHRIDAEVYEYNEASINLLRSLGFQHEGTRRQAHVQKEKYYNVHVFGLLRTDASTLR